MSNEPEKIIPVEPPAELPPIPAPPVEMSEPVEPMVSLPLPSAAESAAVLSEPLEPITSFALPPAEELAAAAPEPIVSLPLPPAAEPLAAAPGPVEPIAPRVGPSAAGATDGVSSDDKLWALLAYVLSPILPIIILLMQDKKDRPFLKQHNMQALVAGIAIIVITLVLGMIPVVGCISPIVALAGWVALIYWGMQAYSGKSVTIPMVTDFVKGRGWA